MLSQLPCLGVMDLQLFDEAARLGGREGGVQGGWCMDVEVVHHQHEALGVWVVPIHHVTHQVRPVLQGAPLGHLDMPPAAQRLADQKQVTDAVAYILVVFTPWPSGRSGQRLARITQHLPTGLIQTDLRETGVVGAGVDGKDVLHLRHEARLGLGRDAPAQVPPRDPGLQRVFFMTLRTVSYETSSLSSSSTARCASTGSVQRLRPAGGALQANATRWASCSPSRSRRRQYTRRGRCRCSAASRPCVSYRRRARPTVEALTPNAAVICASRHPGSAAPASALSRMYAWV